MIFRRTLFPVPLCPRTAREFPAGTVRSRPRRTRFPRKLRCTPVSSITGVESTPGRPSPLEEGVEEASSPRGGGGGKAPSPRGEGGGKAPCAAISAPPQREEELREDEVQEQD